MCVCVTTGSPLSFQFFLDSGPLLFWPHQDCSAGALSLGPEFFLLAPFLACAPGVWEGYPVWGKRHVYIFCSARHRTPRRWPRLASGGGGLTSVSTRNLQRVRHHMTDVWTACMHVNCFRSVVVLCLARWEASLAWVDLAKWGCV